MKNLIYLAVLERNQSISAYLDDLLEWRRSCIISKIGIDVLQFLEKLSIRAPENPIIKTHDNSNK